jgi:hypothetical protein
MVDDPLVDESAEQEGGHMTTETDTRLEAAFHRIAFAHVPDDSRHDLAHADEKTSTPIEAANPGGNGPTRQNPGGCWEPQQAR